jgi:hypothetical protein
MRRIFPVGLLLFVTVQQGCQRDEATARQGVPFGPSAQVAAASRSNIAFTSNRDGNAPASGASAAFAVVP